MVTTPEAHSGKCGHTFTKKSTHSTINSPLTIGNKFFRREKQFHTILDLRVLLGGLLCVYFGE